MDFQTWHEHTTELQNKHGYTGKPKQQRISVYDFVNDYLRPEISWKIFSYAAECPHTEGVLKALTNRRRLIGPGPCAATKRYRHGRWEDVEETPFYHSTIPYTKLPLYKRIDAPYDPVEDEPQRHIQRPMYLYPRSDLGGRGLMYGGKWCITGIQSVSHLKYVNQLVNELKNYNVRRDPAYQYQYGKPQRYHISNKQLADALKNNKVKGHSKLCKGDNKVIHNTRRPAITALIKV